MKVVQIYCHDAYDSMLWDLSSPEVESYFKCQNTNVKLIHWLPRSTFTYLLERHFAKHTPSLRTQILSRIAGFYRTLLNSPSTCTALAHLAKKDPRSPPFRNSRLLKQKTNIDQPWLFSNARIKLSLPNSNVPVMKTWQISFLEKLIELNSLLDARYGRLLQ